MTQRIYKLSRILWASVAFYGTKKMYDHAYQVRYPSIEILYNEKSSLNKTLAKDDNTFMQLIKSFKPGWFYVNPLTGALATALIPNP